ncbi:MAG TPA: WbuC family cupin fold metalloprotein [Nitrospirota bacterium]|nr:WbuC family cupin fold metalloprotein [Nitrospirota bacterium]
MKIINAALFGDLLAKASSSVRRRSNFNIHISNQDRIQRYLVGAKIDSYFRPHRHRSRFELAVVLRGKFDLLLFDDQAVVTARISLGPDLENSGFEMPPDVWHTWIPMVDDSIFLEVKEGPYDPHSAAEFAGWSPPEGDERVADFLPKMRSLAVGNSGR